MACIKKTERKNVERKKISTLDQKGKSFILFGKEKHGYIDNDDQQ
jgi:hypothetical protein